MASAVSLAGRISELRAVSALLAGESGAAAMLVVGEAGVGKSRLVAAAAAAVTRADVFVLSGWCLRLSEDLPFLPLVDVLRALGAIDDGRLVAAAVAECPLFVGGEVLRLMPDLTEPAEPPGPAEPYDGWERQRLFEALRRLFAALGQRRRLAVLIEDMQWADATTLEFLDYLLAPGHATGVPVVLTCRSDEAAATPTLVDWLDRLHRNERVRRLDLAPLTEAETADQIELLIGERPSRRFVADTYARSEGNAFFTEQLVAAGSLDGEGGALPAGLTSLLLSRTGQVTGIARDVLAVLAVAARPLNEAAVARLCERPNREVRGALRDLLARRLLRRPDPAGRHQLRHALLAEAVSGDLLPGERGELHARVAQMMADWNDPAVAAQIAEHLAAAERPADELHWRVIAGRRADAVFASKEAADHWQRALDVCIGASITQVVEGMSLAELYGAAEDALVLSGNEEAAGALAEEALDRLDGGEPASRADVLRRAGEIRGHSSPQRGLELLYQARAFYERLPPCAGHVKVLREIAGILHNDGRYGESADVIDRAATLAERSGQRTAHLEILCVQAWYEMAAGAGELAMERIRTLSERLTERDGPALHSWQAMLHTSMLLDLGRLTEVEAAAAPALQMATAYGMDQSFRTAIVRWNVFEALTELGSVDAAARLIDPVSQEKVGLSTRFDYEARATLEMLRGNLDGAQQLRTEINGLPPTWLGFQGGTCVREVELDLWRGAPEVGFEESHALLVRAAEASQGILAGPLLAFAGPLLIVALRACVELAEHARATRDSEALIAAQRYADQLTDLHRKMRPDPFAPGPLRPAAAADNAMWQAERSRLRGEPESTLWEQAATTWDTLARPHRAAYARWRQAEALLARPGGKASADAVLQTAAGQAAQHVPLATAIADLAQRARIDLRGPGQPVHHDKPPSSRVFGLTDRELAVLRLVGEGKSNPEIGAALFISAKTASVHVTHILRKLDVATRVQAAAVAERAGLLTADPAHPRGR